MPKNTAAQSVAASMNVSFRHSISPEELIQIFKQEAGWQPWLGHLDVFFGEVPTTLIQRFMTENGFSFDQLSAVYNALPEAWRRSLFREMRDAAMGSIVQKGDQAT